MRKIQQINILESLKTLKEAHGELRKQAMQGTITNLLADCQDFALQIKEYVESIAGKGTKTAALLEKYCEIAYHVSVAGGSHDNIKKLAAQLSAIINSAREELIPDRIEIAFFPYQLSMWDALESIYFSAKEDPCCDVYVVPIPWYEKRPDGTLGEMYYDGHQYPDSIMITNWQEYDVAARCPDVAFIHNPYDEGNYVSSVHPEYYSKRLKDCAGLLCYVPYFVMGNSLSEHFVTTAACVYAHKVFVQSEEIRAAYIRILGDWLKENGVGKNHSLWPLVLDLSEKFVAAGSPKFDKVINTKREDCEIPREWAELVKGKKAVLYNTTIGALLHGNEEYLEKLRKVLAAFRRRDDVVLWWRPHPLNETTCQAMRPALLDEYRRISTEYQGSGVGIYDESPLLHRAIAWTDAYYGDASSLVALCQTAGKPILIQSLQGTGLEGTVSMFDLFDDGDSYWFSALEFNALFRMDKATGRAECKGCFPDEELYERRLYSTVNEYNGKLYFTPCSAHEIGVYDMRAGQFDKISIGISKQENDVTKKKYLIKFISAFICHDCLMLVPACYGETITYDLVKGKLSKSSKAFSYFAERYAMKSTAGDREFCLCRKAKRISDSEIAFALFANDNVLVVLNLVTGEFEEHFVGSSEHSYTHIEYDDGCFWLYSHVDDVLVSWNRHTGQTREVNIADVLVDFEHRGKLSSFNSILIIGEYLYLMPQHANLALRLNTATLEIKVEEELSRECEISGEGGVYSELYKHEDGGFLLYSRRSKCLLKTSAATGNTSKRQISMPPDIMKKLCYEYYSEYRLHSTEIDGIRLSEHMCSLDEYLDILEDARYESQMWRGTVVETSSSGESIYGYVRRLALKGG